MKCNKCGSKWETDASRSASITVCPFCQEKIVAEKSSDWPFFDNTKELLAYVATEYGNDTLFGRKHFSDHTSPLMPQRQKNLIKQAFDCGAVKNLQDNMDSGQQNKEIAIKQSVGKLTDIYSIEKYAAERVVWEFTNAICWGMPEPQEPVIYSPVTDSGAINLTIIPPSAPESESSKNWWQRLSMGAKSVMVALFIGVVVLGFGTFSRWVSKNSNNPAMNNPFIQEANTFSTVNNQVTPKYQLDTHTAMAENQSPTNTNQSTNDTQKSSQDFKDTTQQFMENQSPTNTNQSANDIQQSPQGFKDVTQKFIGKLITIISVENGKYVVSVLNESASPLRAYENSETSWGIYQIYGISDGYIALKSVHSGEYVTASMNNNNIPLHTNASSVQAWECFKIYQHDNDYYIKASNDKWVSAQLNIANAPLWANVDVASTWERFNIIILPERNFIDVTSQFANKTIALKSVENNKYVSSVQNEYAAPLYASADIVNDWEMFKAEGTSDGYIAFRSVFNEKYVSARLTDNNVPLNAEESTIQEWECFKLFQYENDYYIKASNDKWVSTRVDISTAPLNANINFPHYWERFYIQILN